MSPLRPATQFIPEHLQPYIVDQDLALYTPMDHASWRFILKISKDFLFKHAHKKYCDGLHETGISTEQIPIVAEMDLRLQRFGWRAVPVNGFIPPAVFMEFQSLGILPIACEMRTLDHLAYTPAPDIVHEAAGHAPIIADAEYAQYLRSYGEVSRKAIFSNQDMAVYQAVYNLSVVKEEIKSTPKDIEKAQNLLDQAMAAVDHLSEVTLLARMNWWTVEYGLVGPLDSPKIYGAGLLSSVGESFHCLSTSVKKIPFSLKCIDMPYDITKPQPQLFVTPDFKTLGTVLEEMASTMAFRVGGEPALNKAIQARTTTTAVLDSGLQISGTLKDFKKSIKSPSSEVPVYLSYDGPTQLAYEDRELYGHGADYHKQGFGSPIGVLKGSKKSPADLSDQELKNWGFYPKRSSRLEFESGVVVSGILTGTVEKAGKKLILKFEKCTVKLGDQTLFKPEWGTFDMACGISVVSVFGNAADRRRYIEATGGFKQLPIQPKCNLTEENKKLNALYAEVRSIRESGLIGEAFAPELEIIYTKLEIIAPLDWLLRLEILELILMHGLKVKYRDSLRTRLHDCAKIRTDIQSMIERGLASLQKMDSHSK